VVVFLEEGLMAVSIFQEQLEILISKEMLI